MFSANDELYALPAYHTQIDELHERFVTINPHGQHYQDFSVTGDIEGGLAGGLARQLGFRSIETSTLPPGEELDLLGAQGKSLQDAIRDTQNLANVHLLYNYKRWDYLRFYKVNIAPLQNAEQMRQVLSKTTLIIYIENESKRQSIAFFSALLCYFTTVTRFAHGRGSCFDQYRQIGAGLARRVMYGPYPQFLDRLALHGYKLDELSTYGLLKSSLFKYYLMATGSACSGGCVAAQKNMLNLGLSKALWLEELPDANSFFVRDTTTNSLTLARSVGVRGKNRMFSYVQTSINDATERLQCASLQF